MENGKYAGNPSRAVGDDSEFIKILDTAEIRKQVNTTDEIEMSFLK